MEEFADRGSKSRDPVVSLSLLGLEVREPSCPNEKSEAQRPDFPSFPPSRLLLPLPSLHLSALPPAGSVPISVGCTWIFALKRASLPALQPMSWPHCLWLWLSVPASLPFPSHSACPTTDPSFWAQELMESSVFSRCQWERSKFFNLEYKDLSNLAPALLFRLLASPPSLAQNTWVMPIWPRFPSHSTFSCLCQVSLSLPGRFPFGHSIPSQLRLSWARFSLIDKSLARPWGQGQLDGHGTWAVSRIPYLEGPTAWFDALLPPSWNSSFLKFLSLNLCFISEIPWGHSECPGAEGVHTTPCACCSLLHHPHLAFMRPHGHRSPVRPQCGSWTRLKANSR